MIYFAPKHLQYTLELVRACVCEGGVGGGGGGVIGDFRVLEDDIT